MGVGVIGRHELDSYCLGDEVREASRAEPMRAPRIAYINRDRGARSMAVERSFDSRFTGNER